MRLRPDQSPTLRYKIDMNGTEPKIEIFKPFGEAFELMKKILFQPFDLKKWLIIGFAAWLAGHFGGVGLIFRRTSATCQKLARGIAKIRICSAWRPCCVVISLAFSYLFLCWSLR